MEQQKCSSMTKCHGKPIKWIWIRAISILGNKRYKILIHVCKKHYKLEKDAGAVIKEGR